MGVERYVTLPHNIDRDVVCPNRAAVRPRTDLVAWADFVPTPGSSLRSYRGTNCCEKTSQHFHSGSEELQHCVAHKSDAMSTTVAQGADRSARLGSAPTSKFLQRLPYLSEASNPVPQLEQHTGISTTRVNPKNLRLAAKVRKTKTGGDNKNRQEVARVRKREVGGEGGWGVDGLWPCRGEKSWRDKRGGCEHV